MNLKYIEWVSKKVIKKEDDDGEFSFDNSNSLFLLLSHLLLYQKDQLGSWDEATKWFEGLKLPQVCASQLEKLEEEETFWDQLKDELKDPEAAAIIVHLL